MSGAGQKIVGGGWAIAAGNIAGWRAWFGQWIDKLPGKFNLVAAGKERGVSLKRIQQQPLIGLGQRVLAKVPVIVKGHIDRRNLHTRPRDLGFKTQVYALIRLDAEGQEVAKQIGVCWKGQEGDALELERDLCGFGGQLFAGAQVKGDALPAPVVNAEFERGIGGGLRFGRDALFLQIALILPQNTILSRNRTHGLEHFGLFIAQGADGGGRFHGRQGEQLQQVVLHHVAQHPGAIIISGAMFHADAFGHCNLHLGDIVAVPQGFKNSIGKPKSQYILHRFFAQIVVNAVDLLLIKDGVYLAVQLAGAGQVMPEWLFDNDAPPAMTAGVQTGQPQLFNDDRVEGRGVAR